MSDQEMTPAAGEATTEVQEAPDSPVVEGQEEDKATSEKDQREELYQTKYQELKKTHEELLDKVNSNAGQPPVQPVAQPEETPKTGTEELEPWTQEWLDARDNKLKNEIVQAVSGVQQQAAQQQEWAEVRKDFSNWTTKNEVPQALVDEAITEFSKRFSGGSPSATVEWVSNYIVEKSSRMRKSQVTDNLAEDAAKKAEELKKVQAPKPGTPPDPQPEQKKTKGQIIHEKFENAGKTEVEDLWKMD